MCYGPLCDLFHGGDDLLICMVIVSGHVNDSHGTDGPGAEDLFSRD